MNDIINKFSLAGDKFMPEMHLKQPQFTYSACGPFIKNKEKIQKFKEIGDSRYIYRNELDKVCSQHDMAYGYFKDLAKRAAADKLLRDKAFNTAEDPKYHGYQRELASMAHKFFNKKNACNGIKFMPQNESPLDLAMQQLAEELHKTIIRKFKNSKTIFGVLI